MTTWGELKQRMDTLNVQDDMRILVHGETKHSYYADLEGIELVWADPNTTGDYLNVDSGFEQTPIEENDTLNAIYLRCA